MNYYCTNSDRIEFVTDDFSETTYSTTFAKTSIIPIDNCIILENQLYDNRELDYWKLAKTKELEKYLNNADNAGYMTTLNIKSDCTENSISKLNLGLSNYNLIATKDTDKVGFCDYNNDLHQITFAQFKQICKEVGADYSNRYGKKWTVRKAINQAKTIAEIQAIVI